MELPTYLHHPPRYVPLPHNPPLPPSLPSSQDPNFFPRPRHLLPPPPPPPPYHPLPPPLSPPPPPPQNPHHSQFTFPNLHRPIEDDRRFDFPRRSPPRVFDRSQFDENPFSDPPRVNRGPLGFNRGPPHHDHSPFRNRIHESPFRTSDNHNHNHRHDLEGGFRFRDNFIDGFKPNHDEEFLRDPTDVRNSGFDSNYRNSHDRDRYGSNSGGSSRGFTFGDSHVSNLGNYQSRHGSELNNDRIRDNREENRRWGYAWPTPRRASDAPVESNNNEFSNTDGIPVVSSRRVPRSYDSRKFSYRGSREGNQEFRQSPKKKIERKSVLDRIQFRKSYKRCRNAEQYFPLACCDDSGPNNFRSRGPFVHSGDRMAEDREGRLVELDVSFKSNALVAKAIVASSSHEVESNRNLTPVSRNIRKLPEPESDLSNLPLTKLSDDPVKSNSSTFALDFPTISFENSKQLGDNAKDSSGGAVSGIGLQPSSCGTDDLPGINTTGSGGTSSLRNRKKKKVISSVSRVPSSQTTKKNVDPVQADCSIHSPPKSAGMIPVHKVDMQPSPNEVAAVSENNKANDSPGAIVSETDGIDIDSGGSHRHNSKRTRTSSTHGFGSPSSLKITVDEGIIVADRSVDLHAMLNSEEGPAGLQNGNTFQVRDLGQQFFQNEPPILLQNGLVKGCSEAKLSKGGGANTEFSSPEETRIYGDSLNLCSTIQDMCNESVELDGFPRAVLSVEGNAIVSLSSAEETNIHERSPEPGCGGIQIGLVEEDFLGAGNLGGWLTTFYRQGQRKRGGGGVETVAAATTPEPGMLHIENVQQRNPSETQMSETDQWQPLTDMKCEGDPLLNGVSTTSLHNEIVEYAPDKLSNMDSTDTLSIVTGPQMFNSKISGQGSNEKGCEDARKQDEKLVFEGLSSSYSLDTALKKSTINKKSGDSIGSVSSLKPKFGPQVPINTAHSLNSVSGNVRKNLLTSAVPRVFPGHPSLKKKTATSSQIAAPRTWHRSGNAYASSHLGKNSYPNPAPPQGQPARKTVKDQTVSYIRKGNSLVRKPSPVTPPNVSPAVSSSVYRLNSSVMDETKKRTGLDATLERPKTPPLPCSIKLSNFTTFSSGKGTSSPLADPPENGCSETESDLLQRKDMDVPKPSEEAPNSSGTHGNQSGQINNNETQSVQEDGNSVSIKSKNIVYVKRKSNQLVATSSSSDRSLQNADKTEALSSDSYYNRRKNQIIRKLSQVAEKVSTPDERKRALPATTSSFSRRRSDKVITVMPFPALKIRLSYLSSPMAWGINFRFTLPVLHMLYFLSTEGIYGVSLKTIVHCTVPCDMINKRSRLRLFNNYSRKLLLSRKRETIYTRSTRGFSLRKSKVLSVGGSSLKWSKSIERNSKKANEEATLAVAAVEKRKREHKGAGAGAATTTATAVTKNRNRSFRKSAHSIELRPGERIFRVGSVRYKMDPTRRTLQRISDEELSNSVALQSGKDAKKSSVPKRLLIGNDEYVRISNGKLIRDPKKRTRMLASEKVRWSLHTARLRLARKRENTVSFSRGLANVTRMMANVLIFMIPLKLPSAQNFLKGSCSDPNCKLTHKVIPERMQDCSYFLQGLCTNESCPYRHVNVNPNASICDGFLRGYCADGNECRKKHSYICPTFEETGICTQGSKCKLHHPKNRNKGKKKKPSAAQKNARGRYFGSNISEHRTLVSEKHSTKHNDDIFCQEGKFADYIHLDFGDDEAEEISDPVSERTSSRDGDLTDMELDVDELIKPFNLIRRSMVIESSPAEDSP
ncbi:zinc finger C-x8-C-x5-C-x3-H type family protein [Actinidia rufa]|uniref:Zinc finger C-x8-C-x5-C-x3-H type family protein n=1 Tax=Actinidia rufa TaxID=165716 RepID=A0A7J0EGJ7_9ERIC|nr:zinc finger C-x8-C-x5-C-x3-H type family protein [Actinidia rufa]